MRLSLYAVLVVSSKAFWIRESQWIFTSPRLSKTKTSKTAFSIKLFNGAVTGCSIGIPITTKLITKIKSLTLPIILKVCCRKSLRRHFHPSTFTKGKNFSKAHMREQLQALSMVRNSNFIIEKKLCLRRVEADLSPGMLLLSHMSRATSIQTRFFLVIVLNLLAGGNNCFPINSQTPTSTYPKINQIEQWIMIGGIRLKSF